MTSKPSTDVTHCPKCQQVLVNPRQLPCIHTFCLKCLELYSDGLEPGLNSSCPVCAAEFEVPYGGLEKLARNRFLEKLIDVRKVTSAIENKTGGCEVCGDDGNEDGAKVAAFYCVQCTQRVCEQCSTVHRRMKVTSEHRLLDLAAGLKPEDLRQLTTLPVSSCDQHPNEAIKVYCNDCRTAICMLCHLERHNSHNCTDVTKVTNDLRRRIKDDINALADDVAKCNVESLRLQRAKADFNKVAEKVKGQIGERAEQLKKLVDNEMTRLMNELSEVKEGQRVEVERIETVLQRHQVALESFIQYSDQLFDHGTACDVASSAEQLHTRANQLQQFDVAAHVSNNFRSSDVTFARSDVEATMTGTNIVGKLAVNKDNQLRANLVAPSPVQLPAQVVVQAPAAPIVPLVPIVPVVPAAAVVSVESSVSTPAAPIVPVETIPVVSTTPSHQSTPPGQPVLGVAAIDDNELFVVRHKTPEIEVYDVTSLAIRRQIAVPGLGSWPYGLAACRANRCLYVSDFVNNAIHRVDIVGSQSTRWSVPGGPAGLSVNCDANVLVALTTGLKVQLYSTQGTVITEFSVAAELAGLSHVVQLGTSGDQFVISHGTSTGQLQRVCVIEKDDTPAEPAAATNAGETQTAEKSHHRSKKLLTIRRHEPKTMSVKPATAGPGKPNEAQLVASFGGAPGGGERQLHGPKGLVVDGLGRILVADRDNNRIVVIDALLSKARDISTAVDGLNLQGPRTVWLDESRGRLFVGEESGGRVIVINNVNINTEHD